MRATTPAESLESTQGYGDDQPPAHPRPFIGRGPWIFGRMQDLLVFGGSALVAVFLVWAFHMAGVLQEPLPGWLWILCILLIDVGHVWSTLFRTLLDGPEIKRRPFLYLGVPALTYVIGASVYQSFGPTLFWRGLAYMAVLHFVRQQAGWLALYRRRHERPRNMDTYLDRVTIYTATLYPLLHWHASGQKSFSWLIDGDFLSIAAALRPLILSMQPAYWGVLVMFLARQALLLSRGEELQLGKVVLVLSTWLCWWLGIVCLDSDVAFTVTNVLIHGVPYLALTYRYGTSRAQASEARPLRHALSLGLPGFLAIVFSLAFVEEMCWDKLVFPDRPWLFGTPFHLAESLFAFAVPLLALPQLTHYLWDGVIWRHGSYPPGPTPPAP